MHCEREFDTVRGVNIHLRACVKKQNVQQNQQQQTVQQNQQQLDNQRGGNQHRTVGRHSASFPNSRLCIQRDCILEKKLVQTPQWSCWQEVPERDHTTDQYLE